MPNSSSYESEKVSFRPLAAYLTGVASWFASMGLQFVMIPTLVIIVLEASAGALALAQMALSVPQLFLLLYAGGVADRSNGRNMLVIIHVLAALPPACLGWLVWAGHLEYWHVIAYSVSMGVVSAFAMPTRDAMLTRVSPRNVQSTVMMALMTQFIAQIIGFTLAGLAAPLAGPWALLVMQALALLIGLVAAMRLPNMPPIEHAPSEEDPQHIADHGWRTGYHVVSQSPTLYPVILATVAVGVFFIGIFMVALPLIVRNVFGGGQLEISILNFCFWGGTICTTLFLLIRPPIRRRGMAMSLALVAGSMALIFVPFAPSFITLCALASAWGLAAGVNLSMSRTIVQIEAPPKARARVLAFYSLGFLGAAPLGAMLVGITAELIGPQSTTGLFAGFMLIFTVWLLAFTPVIKIVRHDDEI